MKTLSEYVREQLKADPEYAQARKVAGAEIELSELLLDLRDELGLSQRGAAAKIGIKAPHLSRLEASTALPTLHTLWKLADAYNACFTFGPDYFVGARLAGAAAAGSAAVQGSRAVWSNAFDETMLQPNAGSDALSSGDARLNPPSETVRNAAVGLSAAAIRPQSAAA